MNNRLLIIEDNEQNLYLMRFLLERSGFTIIGAEDGRKGIEIALSCDPLAILPGDPIQCNKCVFQ